MANKSVENIPTWFLLASLVTSVGALYYMAQNAYLVDAMGIMFPYTVEGMKQRGHPIPQEVQDTADAIDAKNQTCFGNWDNSNLNHWSM